MGASDSESRSTGDVERFLSMLRFDSREKVMDLGIDKDIFSYLKRD